MFALAGARRAGFRESFVTGKCTALAVLRNSSQCVDVSEKPLVSASTLVPIATVGAVASIIKASWPLSSRCLRAPQVGLDRV